MPQPSPDYRFDSGLTFDMHRRYIRDAVTVADDFIDFSQFDGDDIMAPRNAAVPFSPAFVPQPSQGIPIDGVELRHVVTLGADTRLAIPSYRWHVIQHETGHLMGLPDLYLFPGSDVHGPAGAWDNMGLITLGAHFTAWQKRKLGWLTDGEFSCITEASSTIRRAPLESPSGTRGLAVQVSPARALVAEVRRRMGYDENLCDTGLLVYSVDSSVSSGSGPLIVQQSVPAGTDFSKIALCGPPYNATFGLANGKPSSFRDLSSGVTFDILGEHGDGGMTVRVTNPLPVRFFPAVTAAATAGAFGGSRVVAPGSWMEIYGRNLGSSSRSWSQNDFRGTEAPTSLDGLSVTIGGVPAYVAYTSPGQVNVQVPQVTTLLPAAVPVVVSVAGAVTRSFSVAISQRAPGLLAPPSFSANGRRYVAAQIADGTFAGPPGLIAGTAFRRAAPRDVVVIYGVGFGETTPRIAPGQIVNEPAGLDGVTAQINHLPAAVQYAGLVRGQIGLYQFNVAVPDGVSGDVPLSIAVGPQSTGQTLYLAVR